MKRFIITLLSILLCLLVVRAELLWQVSGKGIERPSYLFGTHHVAPVDMLDSIAGFEKAFGSVDAVYGELVMSEMQTPAGQQQLMAAATAPADSTLSSLLTPEQTDSLNAFLQKYMGPQISAAMFDRLKPAMLQTVVAMAMNQVIFPDFDPNQQLDGTIQRLAVDEGKTVGALETMADQCEALFGAPISDQIADLMQVVAADNEQMQMARALADRYMAGDLDGLFAMMLDEMDDATARRLIYDRNDRWIETLKARLSAEPTMYVVGAGHLVGEHGLIGRLRSEGYTVTPVK
ncbi:MAG: TraB/GumN family protein [Bacteroidales bacterium]|nr:TraB/GumN family protein [Bacteroidales bacterium]